MAQPNKTFAVTGEWECAECGHVEEGAEYHRPVLCPECNAGPEAFKFSSYEEDEWDSDVEEDDDDPDFEDEIEDDDEYDEEDDEDEFDESDDFDNLADDYIDER